MRLQDRHSIFELPGFRGKRTKRIFRRDTNSNHSDIPTIRTRSKTCPGCGSGSATFSTTASPGLRITSAFIKRFNALRFELFEIIQYKWPSEEGRLGNFQTRWNRKVI